MTQDQSSTGPSRDVEEIRADLAEDVVASVHPQGSYGPLKRLAADAEALLDRLVAADRENADLHAQLAAAQAQLAAKKDLVNRVNAHLRRALDRAEDAEARLEAVRAVCDRRMGEIDLALRQLRIGDASNGVGRLRRELAALSAAPFVPCCEHCSCGKDQLTKTPHMIPCSQCQAAPQPEPDEGADEAMLNAGGRNPEAFVFEPKRPRQPEPPHRNWPQPEPPASDEPARCEHGRTEPHWLDDWGNGIGAVKCPGPAASGTPDSAEPAPWRVGSHYGIHVYEGDRPVATFLSAVDAHAAVLAYNSFQHEPDGGS